MPRNADFTLDPSQAGKVGAYTRILADKVGAQVEVSFVKRDGSGRTLAGRVESVTPNGSHGVVIVETDKGMRSANLWSITRVVAL